MNKLDHYLIITIKAILKWLCHTFQTNISMSLNIFLYNVGYLQFVEKL